MVRFLGLATSCAITLTAACGGGGGDDMIDALPPNPTCEPNQGSTITTRMMGSFGDVPILVTSPPGDLRLFVVLRDGTIEIIDQGTTLPTPFLDIRDNNGGPVTGGGEQGLLGLAFHPQYATNRKFYVYYTGGGDDVISEYLTTDGDPNVADATSERVLLSIPDFAGNHNGGMIEFGSDGFLYIGTGDGGGSNDPQETGQDLNRLLGKILRIDVDNPSGGREYGIPGDNPFAAGGGAPEVFAWGLRNPWRWSFDRGTGDVYIGDVGQGAVEEISYVPAGELGGKDFGWDLCEGSQDFDDGGEPDETTDCVNVTGNRVRPVYEQVRFGGGGNSDWESVIGGQVYRGTCFPALVGTYFYSDYNHGGVWSFVMEGGQVTADVEHPVQVPGGPTSIHADAYGELYITFEGGQVHRIEAQ